MNCGRRGYDMADCLKKAALVFVPSHDASSSDPEGDTGASLGLSVDKVSTREDRLGQAPMEA